MSVTVMWWVLTIGGGLLACYAVYQGTLNFLAAYTTHYSLPVWQRRMRVADEQALLFGIGGYVALALAAFVAVLWAKDGSLASAAILLGLALAARLAAWYLFRPHKRDGEPPPPDRLMPSDVGCPIPPIMRNGGLPRVVGEAQPHLRVVK